jgi:hypothetical protein
VEAIKRYTLIAQMKLISIIRGSTVNASRPSAPFGYLPEVIAEVTAHYEFVEQATDISKLIAHGEKDAEAPAIFRHGRVVIMGRTLVIDELQIFRNGTIVSTPGPTSDSDMITENVFLWAMEHYNLQFETIRPLAHASQLEVRFERPLPSLFSPLREIASDINQGLGPFWENMPPYEMTTIHFGIDSTKAPSSNSGLFRIERRVGMPFEQGLYFCEAAMPTDSHLKILEKFERICLDKFAKE